MEDIEIIDNILNNQPVGFETLVNKYQLMVINTCYGFVHNREDAEDIAQEVFIEVHKSFTPQWQVHIVQAILYTVL